MFSKILLLTDETTEDRRVSADRRSLPPPPLLKDRTMAMVRSFLFIRLASRRRRVRFSAALV